MTDIYPAFFSFATALLKPRNAPPEALFQISDPTVRNGYRKLYPKPEDVKAAIEAFKKAGMTRGSAWAMRSTSAGPVMRCIRCSVSD